MAKSKSAISAETAADTTTDNDLATDDAATVPALVLHTSFLGMTGERIAVPADQAQALQEAGYIDTHPAALSYGD
ncbi:hypothetical protein [Xanthomonas oryzae]|uniref:hypothetical protein n=1 Tax=Xanthomonas oryzae TaxID=347 RepID=UPI000654D719|nr:hypothetical protein [Xanthomonas oryzae]AKO18942.1 hypothetical protein ACU11_05130 [Xanthomonas oryzae pv. oryzicola]PUE93376.1 hypothetical protein C7T79_13690 [Xanthomonas oryzae pv. oryzicola]